MDILRKIFAHAKPIDYINTYNITKNNSVEEGYKAVLLQTRNVYEIPCILLSIKLERFWQLF